MNCAYCEAPATKHCRTHKRFFCDGAMCAGLHRTAVRPEFCEVVDPHKITPMDFAVRLAAAFGFGLIILAMVAL